MKEYAIADLFEIESTENETEQLQINQLIDYGTNEEVKRFTKEEINELRTELERVEKFISKNG